MRRFELSEGTSNKFWQIERDGSSVTVCFGRIGTAGQSQIKSFASEAAAQAELDKLVKEKLKKGYGEVGAAEATAVATPAKEKAKKARPLPTADEASEASKLPDAEPTVAPVHATEVESSPAFVAPRQASASALAWTEHALREAAPARGSSAVPVRVPDAKASYARLAKAMTNLRLLLDAGEKGDRANLDLMVAARRAFAEPSPPTELDLMEQAAAFAMIGPPGRYDDESRADDFVGFWLARSGGAFAFAALVRGTTLECEAQQSFITLVEHRAVTGSAWWRHGELFGWRGLRRVLALATDEEYARLLARAGELLEGATPTLRALLAAGFERPEWSSADVASMPSADKTPSWFWPLLVSMPSLEDAKTLLEKSGPSGQYGGWYGARAIDQIRFDLIARYGVNAARLLIDTIEAAGPSGVDRVRSLAEALAIIVTSEVAEFFVKQLGERELRAIAAAYLQAHPEVSVLPLAVTAAGKAAVADIARSLLKPIVAAGFDVDTGRLPPSARQLLAELKESAATRAEASADELPRVLSTPPWTLKVKQAAAKVLELSTLPFDDSMHWKSGEAQQRTSGHWLEERPAEAEDNLKKARAASASTYYPGEHSWNMTPATVLAQLPKQELLEILPSLNLGRFNWSYHAVAAALVARHGVEMIELALRSAEVDGVAAVDSLLRARAARVAPLMADAFVRLKKARAMASEWLLSFPDAAAVGLIPAAVGKAGKAREAAATALRFVASRGQRAAIETVAKSYGADAEIAVREMLDFDPLMVFPAKLPKLPSFWSAGALSRPLLAGSKKALPLSAVEALGTMLAFTSVDDPYPGIAAVKDACEPASLAEFAWDLFQAWLVTGAPSKEQWAFQALGFLGNDECARKLSALVRVWPGEAAHARAVVGLDVLGRIGTDVSLMHLHGIAQKLKFKGLQEKAREKIDQIAEARGLTAEELADRLVPDLGLDDDGSLELDFGPRRFRVAFDETLKPAVVDEAGKRLPDLPKPKQSDDAEKAKEAVELWKALKKDAKTIASGQILRLEIAMCAQRRWSSEVFRQFLLDHPLIVHLVRRLVWGVYDESDALLASFRVAEDRTLADERDDTFELPAAARIGIVHRYDLDDAKAASWGQILADYEVLQPFAQLSREVMLPTDAERQGKQLERVSKIKVPTGKVLGLDNRGWRRGPPQDGGVVCWYEKTLAGGLVASLDLEPGIYTGIISESPEQTLGAVSLTKNGDPWSKTEHLTFGTLSPLVFSEIVRDLESLRS